MDEPVIIVGSKYRHKQDAVTWQVINVDAIKVGLTGPGPCRSCKTISLEEFNRDWTEVS